MIREWWNNHLINLNIRLHPFQITYGRLVSHPRENYFQGYYDRKTKITTPPSGIPRRWWQRIYFDKSFIQPKERTMNETITNPTAEAELVTATPLTDAEVEALLAARPGIAVVEADETEDAPVLH